MFCVAEETSTVAAGVSRSEEQPPDLTQDTHISKMIEEIIKKAEQEHEESMRQEIDKSPPHLSPMTETIPSPSNPSSSSTTTTTVTHFQGSTKPYKNTITPPKTGKPAAFELLQMKQLKQQQQQRVYQLKPVEISIINKPAIASVTSQKSPVCYENAFLSFLTTKTPPPSQQLEQRKIVRKSSNPQHIRTLMKESVQDATRTAIGRQTVLPVVANAVQRPHTVISETIQRQQQQQQGIAVDMTTIQQQQRCFGGAIQQQQQQMNVVKHSSPQQYQTVVMEMVQKQQQHRNVVETTQQQQQQLLLQQQSQHVQKQLQQSEQVHKQYQMVQQQQILKQYHTVQPQQLLSQQQQQTQTPSSSAPFQLLMPAKNNIVIQQPSTSSNGHYKPNMIWANFNYYQVNNCETVHTNQNKFYPLTMEPIQQQKDTSLKQNVAETSDDKKKDYAIVNESLPSRLVKLLNNKVGLPDAPCNRKLTTNFEEIFNTATPTKATEAPSIGDKANDVFHTVINEKTLEITSNNTEKLFAQQSNLEQQEKVQESPSNVVEPTIDSSLSDDEPSENNISCDDSNSIVNTSDDYKENVPHLTQKPTNDSVMTEECKQVKVIDVDTKPLEESTNQGNTDTNNLTKVLVKDEPIEQLKKETEEIVVKRKRGRPPKKNRKGSNHTVIKKTITKNEIKKKRRRHKIIEKVIITRNRGRPRRNPLPLCDTATTAVVPTTISASDYVVKQPKVVVTNILNNIHHMVKRQLLNSKTCLISSILAGKSRKHKASKQLHNDDDNDRPLNTTTKEVIDSHFVVNVYSLVFFSVFF